MKLLNAYESFRYKLISFSHRQVDWKLFIFLVLMLNVKIWVKMLALVFIYSTRFDFRFGFRWKCSALPLFYPAVLLIAIANWVLYGQFTDVHYASVMITGLFFWVCCILAIHQLKRSVEHSSATQIHNTLWLFFILNIGVSFFNLFSIILETGAWNPYLYQGLNQKYFIGTGDYIKGLPFDSSTTNALINAFGVVYFLSRKNIICTAGCMITLLLTGSNLTNILLTIALVFSFIFKTDRDQKSLITICFILLIIFLGRVSPQNDQYFLSAIKSMLNIPGKDLPVPIISTDEKERNPTEQKKMRIAIAYLDSLQKSWLQIGSFTPVSWRRPDIPGPDINSAEYQSKMDTTPLQRKLAEFTKAHYPVTDGFLKKMQAERLPGKVIAMQETWQFIIRHPSRLITGNGMGNFSSKLAFRVSALDIAGKYPSGLAYINPDFEENHLRLYLYYFTRHKDVHSVIHTADAVPNQLMGEYGVAGILCFFLYYLRWFIRKIKKTAFSLSLMIIMTGAFFTGYWFEQLSVVILFELLTLSDMKREERFFSNNETKNKF